jgi:hypothetical protein
MDWIAARIKPVMIVSGLLTCTMFFAAVAPQTALRSTFGETLAGPLAEVVVRNWGALVGLVGVMLVYGAYVPEVRPLVLSVAGASKLVFIGLVLAQGDRYLARAAVPIAFDLAMVVMYAAYLLAARGRRGEVTGS